MSIENLVGQQLGQFELRELLGQGGMGAVYRAFQPSLNRTVAIKVLSPALAQDPSYVERFTREAQTIAALEHPHIVPIYDYGTRNNISYVVMRYLRGGSLAEHMEQRRKSKVRFTGEEVAALLKKLGSALDYAHSQGVIHRDIKPTNVMFGTHSEPFLVDFGIAKLLRQSATAASLTATGIALGTPTHMPPEQWRSEPVTGAADQYSLAVVIYTVMTGQLPFEADTPHGLMYKHLDERPLPIHQARNDLPVAVNQVLEQALAKHPGQRFPTVTAFADAFEQAVLSDQPPEARPLTAAPPAGDPTYKIDTDDMPVGPGPKMPSRLPERMPTQPPPGQPSPPPGQPPARPEPPPQPTVQRPGGYAMPEPPRPAPPPPSTNYRSPTSYGPAPSDSRAYTPSPPAAEGGSMWGNPILWLAGLGLIVGLAVIVAVAIVLLSDSGDDGDGGDAQPPAVIDDTAARPTLAAGQLGLLRIDDTYFPLNPGQTVGPENAPRLLLLNTADNANLDSHVYVLPGSQITLVNLTDQRATLALQNGAVFLRPYEELPQGIEIGLIRASNYTFYVQGSCMGVQHINSTITVTCFEGNCSYSNSIRGNRFPIPVGEGIEIDTSVVPNNTRVFRLSRRDAERYQTTLNAFPQGQADFQRCVAGYLNIEPPGEPSATPQPTDTQRPSVATATQAPTLTPLVTPTFTPTQVIDSDGDGVPDNQDNCPARFGDGSPDGCPDADGDGISYSQDRCPEAPGPENLQGCPDTDSDGIPDIDDACPDQLGVPEYDGCPPIDTDGDGLADSEDDCPNTWGLAQYGGCPDSDGDTVRDIDDNCPQEAGPPANDGCPLEDSNAQPE